MFHATNTCLTLLQVDVTTTFLNVNKDTGPMKKGAHFLVSKKEGGGTVP